MDEQITLWPMCTMGHHSAIKEREQHGGWVSSALKKPAPEATGIHLWCRAKPQGRKEDEEADNNREASTRGCGVEDEAEIL